LLESHSSFLSPAAVAAVAAAAPRLLVHYSYLAYMSCRCLSYVPAAVLKTECRSCCSHCWSSRAASCHLLLSLLLLLLHHAC
jgi:hypothetical protein